MKKVQIKQGSSLSLKTKIRIVAVATSVLLLIGFGVVFFYFNLGLNHSARAVTDNKFTTSQGTYSPINSNNTLGNSSNDENTFVVSLGFTFRFDGNNYTQVAVSSNGYIAMGSSLTSSSFPLSTGTNNNVISALGGNLQGNSNSTLKYITSGSSPNRIFTIQWEKYRFKNESNESFDFQIKLYESSNVIRFVYGNFTKNSSNKTAQVGLRGSSNSVFFNRTIPSGKDWSTTDRGTSNSSSCTLTSTLRPASGLTFTFAPPISDLTLSITASDATPCIGNNLLYTINLANNGPGEATNIKITSAIPPGLSFQSATASAGTYNASTGVWSVASLPNSGSSTLIIYTTINNNQTGATIVSNASISSLSELDNNSSNNSDSETVKVLNNAPTISAISDITTNYNVATNQISFTVGDVETSASLLTVSATSSNTTCVPNENITLTGSGSGRSVKITPGTNQSGSSTITLYVTDGTCTKTTSFVLTVYRQTYATWQEANIVVGQLGFNAVDATTINQTIGHGSNNAAVSSKGVLAVGSQTAKRVLLWKSVPKTNGVPADFVVGKRDFISKDSAATDSTTWRVDGVAFSPDGNKLIISDAGNNRVLIYNSIPTKNGAKADVVIGQPDFVTSTSGVSAVKLNRPTELLVTPGGKLIIVDRDNHRVLIYNRIPTKNNVAADVVIGQTNFTNKSFSTTDSTLRLPWNCSMAPDGKLLIADNDNNRVLIFNSIPTKNGAKANVVVGQNSFTTRATGCTNTALNYIAGVTVSPTGMMAIADFRNNRVMIYNSVPTTNGKAADAVLGQPSFTTNTAWNNGSNATGSPSDKNMYQPYGINYDLNERLLLNGRGMHRVMIFGKTPAEVCDLSLNIESDKTVACIGTPVTYTIKVNNNGPSNATNVIVTTALPYGLTFKNHSLSNGTYNTSSGFWTIPSIPIGSSATLSFTGTVEVGQGNLVLTTYANIRSSNQADNKFSNNSGSVNVTITNNYAPVISTINDYTVDINTTTDAIEFTVTDSDASSAIQVSASSSNQLLVKNSNISLTGTGANRTVTVTPESEQNGSTIITLTANDGVCSTLQTFKLNVGNTWLGYTADWNTLSNWSSSIPTENISAFIPASPEGGYFPVISNSSTCKDLVINSGAKVTVNAARVLNIKGDFTNDGESFTGNGNIIFNGTSRIQNIKGNIGNFIVNNPFGLTMNGDVNSNGTISLTLGRLSVNAFTITIQKPLEGTINNFVTVPSSSVYISGSSAGIFLPETVSSLNNFNINNANGVSLRNNLTITGILTLKSGELNLRNNNLTLQGPVTSSVGSISSEGNSDLTLSGTGDVGPLSFASNAKTIRNLVMNRNGSLILSSDLLVNNTLTLTNGLIKTGTRHIAVTNPAPNSIVEYNAKSYIHGHLRRYVSSTGSYDFPVGCGKFLQKANINLTSSSGIAYIDGTFNVKTLPPPASLMLGETAIQDLLDYGYWTIEPDNYLSVEYDITFTAKGHSNGGTLPSQHTIVKRHDATSEWRAEGMHNNAWVEGYGKEPITATRKGITSFSDYAFGIGSQPMPVEYINFRGMYENKAVKLNWGTYFEVNNDRFEIERSSDAIYFTKIGEVKGKGNSNIKNYYEFIDRNSIEKLNFYRLKQVDNNGKEEYSNIILVESGTNNKGLSIDIYPNPAKISNIQVVVNSPDKNKDFSIFMFDIEGKIIVSKKYSNTDLSRVIKIEAGNKLSPRNYFIKVVQGGISTIKEIILIE